MPHRFISHKLAKFWLLSFFLISMGALGALVSLPSLTKSVNAESVTPRAHTLSASASATKIRQQAPNISFVNADGTRMSLQQFRGKVVLLNIWASWCGHCKKELGSLADLQTVMKMKGAPFQLVCLNIDTNDAVGRALLKERKLPIAFFHDASSESLKAFESIWVPTTVLIDPTGAVVQVYYGEMDWAHDAPFKTLLASLLQESGWKEKH